MFRGVFDWSLGCSRASERRAVGDTCVDWDLTCGGFGFASLFLVFVK